MMFDWGQQLSRHAFPADCFWLFLLVRAGGPHRLVMGGEQFSLGEVRQRWTPVWDVATKQDAEPHRITRSVHGLMPSCLSVSLPNCQLLEELTSLSALLLHPIIQYTTGLRQLPGEDYFVSYFRNTRFPLDGSLDPSSISGADSFPLHFRQHFLSSPFALSSFCREDGEAACLLNIGGALKAL